MAGLQETFLTECKRAETPIVVVLLDGTRLRGAVKNFDPFTLLLESGGKPSLIYKHAIASIVPETELRLVGG